MNKNVNFNGTVIADPEGKWKIEYIHPERDSKPNADPLDDQYGKHKIAVINGRQFSLIHDGTFGFYTIIWDRKSETLPDELKGRFTNYGTAAEAIQTYLRTASASASQASLEAKRSGEAKRA